MMCFAPIRPGHSPTPMHPPGGEGDAPVRSSRHPFPCSGTSGLRLQTGDVNNMYRTLEELWNMYARGGMRNAAAFVPIFRMGLRLLIDTAAMERCGGLDRYVASMPGKRKNVSGRRQTALISLPLCATRRCRQKICSDCSRTAHMRILRPGTRNKPSHEYPDRGNAFDQPRTSMIRGDGVSWDTRLWQPFTSKSP